MKPKITFEEYLQRIAAISNTPISLGIYLAASGKEPMSEELLNYLKECYEMCVSPHQAVEDWI